MNNASTELTQEEMLQCDRQDRELEQTLARHHIGTENVTVIGADTLFGIDPAINPVAWALRATANDALWWAFTAYLNKDRKPAETVEEEMPAHLKALLAEGADDRDTEQESPLGLEAPLVHSSWQSWANAHMALAREAIRVAVATSVPLKDRIGDGGKVTKGFVSYIRTPAEEAAQRDKREQDRLSGSTLKQELVPAWLRERLQEGVQTVQGKQLQAARERHAAAALELNAHLATCVAEIALQPHEVAMLLERFIKAFEQAMGRELTSSRMMNYDGSLKEDALGTMALADGIRKDVELELEQLCRDYHIPAQQ